MKKNCILFLIGLITMTHTTLYNSTILKNNLFLKENMPWIRYTLFPLALVYCIQIGREKGEKKIIKKTLDQLNDSLAKNNVKQLTATCAGDSVAFLEKLANKVHRHGMSLQLLQNLVAHGTNINGISFKISSELVYWMLIILNCLTLNKITPDLLCNEITFFYGVITVTQLNPKLSKIEISWGEQAAIDTLENILEQTQEEITTVKTECENAKMKIESTTTQNNKIIQEVIQTVLKSLY
jgi:hypothetical protein